MIIDNSLIDYVASLSRLKVQESERERLIRDLGNIIGYIEMLNELDVAGVEAMSHAFDVRNVFREDTVEPSMDRELVLQNAPAQKDGCFKVPKAVE
ncbi:MAG: Asp-tRNA(Asn)/Glu-tRNA(Gln) amidotransferase subunit GatC [Clostridia bacterium]|nr:Asp-tRNA(Asn)/Glu-tRNA(Gln) amidotransferase subunit GatC [Clostridia bacterium]